MEGVAKIVIGTAIVGAGLYLAVAAHSIYHGGVSYTFQSKSLGYSSLKPRSRWDKTFWVFTLSKGPGRENIDRDLQRMVDEEEGAKLMEGDAKFIRICTCCGATNEEIVVKQNQ